VADVAGVHPAVRLDRGPGGRLVAVVTEHDQRPADHQLARLAVGQSDARVVQAGDPGLRAGQREADRAVHVGHVDRVGGARAAQLGHAPQFEQGSACPALPFGHLGGRHGLPAHAADPQRGQVGPGQRRVGEHHRVHGRHAVEHGRAVPLDRRQSRFTVI